MAKEETLEKVSISISSIILGEIDQIAKELFASRSAVFTRIYLEWKQANRPQLPGLAPTEAPQKEAEKC